MVLSKDYVEDRILKDHSSGISIDGKLVAWILTHDDGAIGCLNVLEEYRNQGMGSAIVTDIIKKIRGDGRIPFVYIDVGNEKAEEIATKFGFVKQKPMSWLCLSY
jgi:8-oxo-dGTP diphosphatase